MPTADTAVAAPTATATVRRSRRSMCASALLSGGRGMAGGRDCVAGIGRGDRKVLDRTGTDRRTDLLTRRVPDRTVSAGFVRVKEEQWKQRWRSSFGARMKVSTLRPWPWTQPTRDRSQPCAAATGGRSSRSIRHRGTTSRAEIAKRTGLSTTTVSTLIGTTAGRGRGGRAGRPLDVLRRRAARPPARVQPGRRRRRRGPSRPRPRADRRHGPGRGGGGDVGEPSGRRPPARHGPAVRRRRVPPTWWPSRG